MEFIYEYGLFLAQAVTLVAAILIVVVGVVSIGMRQRSEHHEGHIEIRDLNEKYRHIADAIRDAVDDEEVLKLERKAEKKAEKNKAKATKKALKKGAEAEPNDRRKRLYVLNFDGDIKANGNYEF